MRAVRNSRAVGGSVLLRARHGRLTRWRRTAGSVCACVAGCISAAFAQSPGAVPSLWERSNLLGNLGGVRPTLADYGVTLGIVETSEVLGNPVGGERQTVIYEGVTQLSLNVDAGKLLGIDDGIFYASAFQVHGRGLSLNALDNNINTASGLESLRGTLLYELWYEQGFFDYSVKIRFGQLGADQEFLISQTATLFVNHSFGWPGLPNADLPASGPASPLAAPGARIKWAPKDDVTFLLAAFDGNPAGPGAGAPQSRDASGTDFRLNDGVLAMAELQYSINSGDKATGLPGTYKIGGWYNSDSFADMRLDEAGFSLADPAFRGIPALSHRGDYSVYAIADQTLWQPDKTRSINGFARIMGAPGDRNLVSFYADGGVTGKGLVSGRDNDTAGIGFAFARIGDAASALDSDTAFYTGRPYPVRGAEKLMEITYQAAIAPWWQVQPSVQFVLGPGGGVPDPLDAARRLPDAVITGLRTTVTF
jgi:porin